MIEQRTLWDEAKDVNLMLLAAEGLEEMFDSEKNLFCFRFKRTERGFAHDRLSPRYTAIALLGLHRLETFGIPSPISIRPAMQGLLSNAEWVNNIGDLGLLLWLSALATPELLVEIFYRFDVQHALDRYRDAREGRTMELAWFLTGISYATRAHGKTLLGLTEVAHQTFGLLKNNQGEAGFWGHLALKGTWEGAFRGRIGSFADQVYPTYAFARFSQVYGSKDSLERSLRCARAICRVQGPLGQWWWHYDSVTGEVAGNYPVYSVHQDGMAPMALLAVSEAASVDFSSSILRGMRWIDGHNELGCDVRVPSAKLIWRGISLKGYRRYLQEFRTFFGFGKDSIIRDDLAVMFECRPYHLGWILYAFAGHYSRLRSREPGATLPPPQDRERDGVSARTPERSGQGSDARSLPAAGPGGHGAAGEAGRLEREHPSAAASLREGLAEMFTVNRLGLSGSLARCLSSTNIIESPSSGMRLRTRTRLPLAGRKHGATVGRGRPLGD